MKTITKILTWIMGIVAILLVLDISSEAGTPPTVVSRQGGWQLVQLDDGNGDNLILERMTDGGRTRLSRMEVPRTMVTNVYWDSWAGNLGEDGYSTGAVVTNVTVQGADFHFQAFVNAGRAYWEDWTEGKSRLWSVPCEDPGKKTLLAVLPSPDCPWMGTFHAEPHLRGVRWIQPSRTEVNAKEEMVSEDGTSMRRYGNVEALQKRASRSGHAARYAGSGGENPPTKEQEVLFNANGGKFSGGEATMSMSYTVGETYGSLPFPTLEGSAFLGWYTALQGGDKITGESPVQFEGKRTLFAHWQVLVQKVTFNAHGGHCDTETKDYYIGSGNQYGWLPEAKKSGYEFNGWYTKKSGGTHVTVHSYITTEAKRELHAQWTKQQPQTHLVTFDANGGKGSMEAIKVLKGKTQALPANTFKREGYTFVGWAKTAGGEKVYGDGEEIEVTGDMTLYAVWERDTYQIRFHGNLYAESEADFVDQTFTFGEEQALMANPFTERIIHHEDISGEFLGWSVGTPEFDWNAGVRWWVDRKSVKLEEADLLEYARTGTATVEDGVPTLHLYAVWRSKVTVEFHGPDGGELAPASMKDHVQFRLDDNKWSFGGNSFYVGPGTHTLRVVAEAGYEGYIAGWRLFWGETDLTDGAAVGSFTISSVKTGPYDIRLEVRLSETAARGEVTFRCVDARTDAQKAVWSEWPNFPAFDEGKVKLSLRPKEGDAGRLEVRNGEREALPVGTYILEVDYVETAGSMKLPFWEKESPQTITVEAGKSQEVSVPFLPFGRNGTYSFALLTFDGVGGDVSFEKMWFVAGRTTAWEFSNDKFSVNRLPTVTRKGGWKFDGWQDWKERKIESLNDLATSVKRWLNAEPPLRTQTFTAQWTKMEDTATGSGEPVTYAWLDKNATDVLAANGGDYEAAALATAANGKAMWECYVAGMDPADKEASFKAELLEEEEKCKVGPVGGKKEGRIYRVEGKKEMTDEEWTDVTDVEDLEAEGWRFFRLGVELAE